MAITRIFATASGLKLNEGKTLVIALNPGFLQEQVLLPAPLRLQAVGQLSRYLGIQVGSRPDIEYSWKLAHQQLVTRMTLAVQKTTTVDQRSLVVVAVVIPKLLYIGRHQWLTNTIVERFQKCIHNYIWHAQFTFSLTSRKAWMNATVAALPRDDGGIAAPSLKLELLAMAASTVASWAQWSTSEQLIVGDVLGATSGATGDSRLMVAPSLIHPRRSGIRWGLSIWETGVTVCSVHEMDDDKVHMVAGPTA